MRIFSLVGILVLAPCADALAQPATPAPAPPAVIAPETALKDPENDPAWRDLFRALAARKTRQSSFEERRYFPFRQAPVVLKGEVRIVPELGLSLRYLEPEARVMIVDAKGLLVREADGRERPAPNDSRAQAATSALVSVLRFDLEALKRDFVIHGRRDDGAWTLGFAPRDPAFAQLLGVLVVSGERNVLGKIEMIKSPTQRIEIVVRESMEDVLFTGDTLRRFFR